MALLSETLLVKISESMIKNHIKIEIQIEAHFAK